MARLVFLTGSKAGTTLELGEADVTIGRTSDRTVAYSVDDVLVSTAHATVRFRDRRYIVRDDASRNGTFVNSQRVTERALDHGDLIQFGPGGPAVRFVMEVKPGVAMTLDLAAQSERAMAERGATVRAGSPVLTTRDLVAITYYRLTSRIRRTAWVVIGFVVLAIAGLALWQRRSEARVERALTQLSAALAASRSSLQQDVAALEARYATLRDVVAGGGRRLTRVTGLDVGALSDYTRGVVLITSAYGYTRAGGTELLRYDFDSLGQMIMTRGPEGRPVPSVSFAGSGPPLLREGAMTGFLIDSTGYVLTSSQAAEPWAQDPELKALRAQGWDLKGRLIELRAYLPPGERSFPLVIHRRSADADLAVLRTVGRPHVPFLQLAADTVLVRPGDPVVFIGYPTDVRTLLFRVDSTERNDILRRAGDGAQRLVQELGRRRLIQPLIADGSVTTTSASELVHTAGGSVGGGGGPLLDAHRRVVAVQQGGVSAAGAPQRGVRVRYGWDILPFHVQRALGAQR